MERTILINKLLQPIGIQIKKYPLLDSRRRISLIRYHGINKIIDVGANSGIYGLEMRKFGYTGEIVSFEPLSEAFSQLSLNSAKDNRWQIRNYALGDFDGETSINISRNSVSSSILEMLPVNSENEKETEYINSELIRICKFDSVFDDFYNTGDRVFVKIDTQGYEMKVLEGALKSLAKIEGFQIELSLVSLYKGSSLYTEIIEYLSKFGFSLFSVENGFYDPTTGRLLQFDGIFFRENNG